MAGRGATIQSPAARAGSGFWMGLGVGEVMLAVMDDGQERKREGGMHTGPGQTRPDLNLIK